MWLCVSDAEDFDVDKGFVDESKEEEEDLALAVSSNGEVAGDCLVFTHWEVKG